MKSLPNFICPPRLIKYFILFGLISSWSCVYAQGFECYTKDNIEFRSPTECYELASSIDLGDPSQYPEVTMKVYFHFVKDINTGENFHDDPTGGDPLFYAPNWISNHIYNVNNRGFDFPANNNSPAPVMAIGDGRIRVEHYSTDTDPGYKFYDLEDEIDLENLDLSIFHIIFISTEREHSGGAAPSIGGGENYIWYTNYIEHRIEAWMNRGNFWHEFGHIMGLDHPFRGSSRGGRCIGVDITCEAECDRDDMMCIPDEDFWDECNTTTNNIMQIGSRHLHAFTPCQWSVVYTRAVGLPFVSTVASQPREDEIVSGNVGSEIVWHDRVIFNNIVVTTGTTLRVEGSLSGIQNDLKIIVQRGAKIILDGACITNLSIELWGNTAVPHRPDMHLETLAPDDPGVVWIKNYTSIYGANPAITTRRSGAIPWEQKKTYWGGYIYATDSKFINNRRSIEFMSYHHPNLSYFEDVDFEADIDQIGQVTIWDTEGITFRNCHFEDKDAETDDFAIGTIDGSFKVYEECLFRGYDQAITIMGTVPFIQEVEIGDNDYDPNLFIDNETSIVINTAKDVFIENNSFAKGRAGINIDGESGFQISNNGFYELSRSGIDCNDTGRENNDIKENSFQEVGTGIFIYNHNKLIQFDLNCFNTRNNDVFARTISRLDEFPSQGGTGRPVFNAFTEGGVQFYLRRRDETVKYYHWDNPNLNPLFIPICDLNSTCPSQYDFTNVLTFSSSTSDVNTCIPIIPGFTEPEECYTKACYNEYRDRIDEIEKQLNGYDIDVVNGDKLDESKTRLIADLKADLVYWQKKKLASLHGLVRKWKADGKYEDIAKIFKEDGDKSTQQKLVGLLIYLEKYDEARSVLGQIAHDEEGDSEFEQIQKINIDRAEYGTDYRPSLEDQKWLKSIAESDNRVAGYAKSLHTLLYGTYWPIKDNEEIGFRSNGISSSTQKTSQEWHITNPAHGLLHISRPAEYTDEEVVVRLVAISGQAIFKDRWSSPSDYRRDIAHVANGVYIVDLILDNNRILSQKVIVQNP